MTIEQELAQIELDLAKEIPQYIEMIKETIDSTKLDNDGKAMLWAMVSAIFHAGQFSSLQQINKINKIKNK